MRVARILGAILLGGGICLLGCTSDILDPIDIPCETSIPITYTNSTKSIIDASCAYAGCHAGQYDSFAGIQSIIDNGKFKERVITMRDDVSMGMPPNYATAGPKDLTEAELEIIQCWIDGGYQE
ncbi:MAG: hypothetical protein ACPG5P_06735 [Saprospiraceae bacterium]